MHTLFNPNILTHSPPPAPQTNPFDLSFPSSQKQSHAANTNSSASSSASPPRVNILTGYQQDVRQGVEQAQNAPSKTAASYPRRKGNPKLLMMGQRRSGKSSIESVIFQKMAPAETLYLETTNATKTTNMQSFQNFEILELPSHLSADSPEIDHRAVFGQAGAVIWVIDVQDEYLSSIAALVRTAMFLSEHYPRVNLEVLIHKTDGLSDEYRYDAFREVRQRIQDEFSDVGLDDRSVSIQETSIFDYSIFVAVSKIVQKLLLQLDSLEAMLNKLCSSCGIQKAFLFDTTSKLYIATDASPTFSKDYEACSDYLDVLIDLKALYTWQPRHSSKAPSEPKSEDDENEHLGESIITTEKTGDTYIIAKEVTEHLTLICVMGKGSGVDKRLLIDYNIAVLQEAIVKIFKV